MGREKTYRVLAADRLSSKGIEFLKGEEKITCYVEANMSPGELRATIGEYDSQGCPMLSRYNILSFELKRG
jgi:hypothetical protein